MDSEAGDLPVPMQALRLRLPSWVGWLFVLLSGLAAAALWFNALAPWLKLTGLLLWCVYVGWTGRALLRGSSATLLMVGDALFLQWPQGAPQPARFHGSQYVHSAWMVLRVQAAERVHKLLVFSGAAGMDQDTLRRLRVRLLHDDAGR